MGFAAHVLEIKLLLLIGIANGAPVLVKRAMGPRLSLPLDLNHSFIDGRPIFGPSKTIRGLISSLLITAFCSPLFGFPWLFGVWISFSSMLGDLFSSFLKRRLAIPSSSMALGIDQIPEALFPMLVSKHVLGLSWLSVLYVVVSFFVLAIVASRILHKFNIRKVPY